VAAIRSFFRLVEMKRARLSCCTARDPGDAQQATSADRDLPRQTEIDGSCSPHPIDSAWAGRRDLALLLVALQTGIRESEIISLLLRDVIIGTGRHTVRRQRQEGALNAAPRQHG